MAYGPTAAEAIQKYVAWLNTPPPTSYAFIDVFSRANWGEECDYHDITYEIPPSEIVGTAPAINVGGRTPDSSARYLDSGYGGTSLAWCFETEKVCIHYRRAAEPRLELSAAAQRVFSTVTWSSN